jgi:hypothetical protein
MSVLRALREDLQSRQPDELDEHLLAAMENAARAQAA